MTQQGRIKMRTSNTSTSPGKAMIPNEKDEMGVIRRYEHLGHWKSNFFDEKGQSWLDDPLKIIGSTLDLKKIFQYVIARNHKKVSCRNFYNLHTSITLIIFLCIPMYSTC